MKKTEFDCSIQNSKMQFEEKAEMSPPQTLHTNLG